MIANKRKEKDVMKLLVSDYEVEQVNEITNQEFIVKFYGPKDSHYEGVSTMQQFYYKCFRTRSWLKSALRIVIQCPFSISRTTVC